MINTPVTRVPGAKVRSTQKGEFIIWPSGLRTKMHLYPLRNHVERELYHLDPIRVDGDGYKALIKN